MKTFSTRMLLIASLVLLALGVAAGVQAQSVVKCNVPFEFSLGGQMFPAGVYSFTVGSGPGSRFVQVRNWDASRGEVLQADVEDEPLSVDTLVSFNRYGNRYLLSSVSLTGDGVSVHFSPTHAEREMMLGSRAEVVSIRASR